MIILLNIVWFIVAFIALGFMLDPFYQGTYQVNDFSKYLAIEIFKCVMLLLPANIAHRKGRSFSLFAIYGILLWIAAIMHSIMMSGNKVKAELKKYKACPYCGEAVLKVAKNVNIVMKCLSLKYKRLTQKSRMI